MPPNKSLCGLLQEDAKGVPNVNIPVTETIKLVRTYQEKRRRQPIKKSDGHGRTGEEKKGGGLIDGDGSITTETI